MDNASDFNYECEEHCETCDKVRTGTMHHCNDSMGIATPVLWTCHYCENPPVLVALYRSLRTKLRLRYNRAKYVLTVPRAERERRAAHFAAAKRRMEERRAARAAKEEAA